ncbi:MAG: hypothetical protein AAGH68_10615 [Pseudomonadota bacterium]
MKFAVDPLLSADDGEHVGEIQDLTTEEQHILRAIRIWMGGPAHHWQLRSFLHAAGVRSHQVKSLHRALDAFMANIAIALERQLWRHMPCCPQVSRDERLLLDLLHSAGTGEHQTAVSHAHMISRKDRVEAVADAAAWLSEETQRAFKPELSGVRHESSVAPVLH